MPARAFRIHKSLAFAAAARAVGVGVGVGVPSRLAFADVRDHPASKHLKQLIGGEVLFHALAPMYSNGR